MNRKLFVVFAGLAALAGCARFAEPPRTCNAFDGAGPPLAEVATLSWKGRVSNVDRITRLSPESTEQAIYMFTGQECDRILLRSAEYRVTFDFVPSFVMFFGKEGGEDHTATFRAEAGHSYVLDVSRDLIRPRFDIEIEDTTARELVFERRDTPP